MVHVPVLVPTSLPRGYMRARAGENSGQNSQQTGGQSGAATQVSPLCLRTLALPLTPPGCSLNLGKGAARLEGLRKLSPGAGTELATVLKRTKAKEEGTRLEEPHGAASWGKGTQKPGGEVRGDETQLRAEIKTG